MSHAKENGLGKYRRNSLLTCKRLDRLTPEEKYSISRLGMRGGSLRPNFRSYLKNFSAFPEISKCRVILYRQSNKIVAWGLYYYPAKHKTALELYVNKKYRRQGIGTKIVNRAKKLAEADDKILQVYKDRWPDRRDRFKEYRHPARIRHKFFSRFEDLHDFS